MEDVQNQDPILEFVHAHIILGLDQGRTQEVKAIIAYLVHVHVHVHVLAHQYKKILELVHLIVHVQDQNQDLGQQNVNHQDHTVVVKVEVVQE